MNVNKVPWGDCWALVEVFARLCDSLVSISAPSDAWRILTQNRKSHMLRRSLVIRLVFSLSSLKGTDDLSRERIYWLHFVVVFKLHGWTNHMNSKLNLSSFLLKTAAAQLCPTDSPVSPHFHLKDSFSDSRNMLSRGQEGDSTSDSTCWYVKYVVEQKLWDK